MSLGATSLVVCPLLRGDELMGCKLDWRPLSRFLDDTAAIVAGTSPKIGTLEGPGDRRADGVIGGRGRVGS